MPQFYMAIATNQCEEKHCPICRHCWDVIDDEQKENIKQAYNLDQPEEWSNDTYKFCQNEGCWGVVPKAKYRAGYCKACIKKSLCTGPSTRSRTRSRTRSSTRCHLYHHQNHRGVSWSRSRSPRKRSPSPWQPTQPDSAPPRQAMSEMKRVLLKGKILQKQLVRMHDRMHSQSDRMQLEMNNFMIFVAGAVSKEAAGTSGRGYQSL